MTALHIALKDIQIFLKDRGNVIYLFLVPMVFILVISLAIPDWGGDQAGEPITLPVVNLDPGGQNVQAFIDGLNAGGGVQVELYDQAEADARLKEWTISYILTIPANFSEDIAAGRPVTLLLVNHPNADDTITTSLLRAVNGVAQEMSLQAQLIAALGQMGDMQAVASSELQAFTPERNLAQAKSQFERSRTAPLVVVEQTKPQELDEAVERPNGVQQNVPGYTIIFVFTVAQATALSIYNEKKVGSFRRLLAAPMSKATLLAGKLIPNYIIGLIQIVVIFGTSVLIFPLLGLERLTLGSDPLALALVSLLLPLCSAGLGILFAAIARTEGQIGGVGTLLLWGMGALGGCLIPLFALENLLGPMVVITRAVPHSWAIKAYQDLMVRGRVLSDITTELLALLVFAVVFFTIGVWRFDFD
jgi:ABC-2 type transport system permease protein